MHRFKLRDAAEVLQQEQLGILVYSDSTILNLTRESRWRTSRKQQYIKKNNQKVEFTFENDLSPNMRLAVKAFMSTQLQFQHLQSDLKGGRQPQPICHDLLVFVRLDFQLTMIIMLNSTKDRLTANWNTCTYLPNTQFSALYVPLRHSTWCLAVRPVVISGVYSIGSGWGFGTTPTGWWWSWWHE